MKRLGLCLSGGGARGAYQVGVLKAMEELGILDKVYAISGTSIGSVNASFLACKTVDEMKELWLNYPISDFIKNTSVFKTLRERKMEVVSRGIYEISALETLLNTNLDIQKLKEKKVFVTLSPAGMENEGAMGLLKASFNHYIKNDSQVIYSPLHEQDENVVTKQILASCSIPFVFPSVSLNGQQVFDGGLYDNAPVKPLIEAGCDTIIVIHLMRLYFINKNKYPGIVFHELKHWHSLGGVLNFDNQQAKRRYEIGYEDGKKYFQENPIY